MYISEKDIEFAKTTLSDFVNGGMSSPKTVVTGYRQTVIGKNTVVVTASEITLCLTYFSEWLLMW